MSTDQLGRPHRSTDAPAAEKRARRGTSNRDARGSTTTRRRRRQWLVDAFRADVDLVAVWWETGRSSAIPVPDSSTSDDLLEALIEADARRPLTATEFGRLANATTLPACRCYRCGALLHAGHPGDAETGAQPLEATVTADRIVPGGTYARGNIRPCCGPCNESTGGKLGAARKKVGKRS